MGIERDPLKTVLAISRTPHAGEFSSSEIELLRWLAPHLRRAHRIFFQISSLKARAEGAGTALDMLSTGIALLGPKGEIVMMNRAASHIASQGDGLLAGKEGLRTVRASEGALLEKLILSL